MIERNGRPSIRCNGVMGPTNYEKGDASTSRCGATGGRGRSPMIFQVTKKGKIGGRKRGR